MSDLTAQILGYQNTDGGWGWKPARTSWTEPTAFALIALPLEPQTIAARQRATAWLMNRQAPDGGIRPHASVNVASTTTTALSLLVPEMRKRKLFYDRGINWLLKLKGRGPTLAQRLLGPLFGAKVDGPGEHPGWPFVPGTAPWVTPTSLAIMALARASSARADVVSRLQEARGFLQSRVCRDGGWNHGAARTLEIDLDSYPETTGIAMAALQGVHTPVVKRGLSLLPGLLDQCASSEGTSWLRIALSLHGQNVVRTRNTRPATNVELALELLADRAAAGEKMLVNA